MRLVFLALLVAVVTVSAVEVSIMMPLNLVDNSGYLHYSEEQLTTWFYRLTNASIHNVMADVWWGITEPQPKHYNFDAYVKFLTIAKKCGLKVQFVTSFHRCGGNVGDDCNIPLPDWILEVGYRNPDIWYTDQHGHRDTEYVSLFVDNEKLFHGRSPVQIYADWIDAFTTSIKPFLLSTVTEYQVGLGPCGELRYPSYQLDRWQFCGVGAFQCYDSYARASLRRAAEAIGKDWSGPPSDAGSYNSRPEETNFFRTNGGYASEYGNFFLKWYADQLLVHFENVIGEVRKRLSMKGLSSFPLAVKNSGLHWQYRHASHAAELTGGYYNTNGNDGYGRTMHLYKKYNVIFDFTCLEMQDHEQPQDCLCSPYNLVGQTIKAAKFHGIEYAGENAIQGYSQNKFDTMYDQATRFGTGSVKAITILRLSSDMLQDDNFKRLAAWVDRISKV
ncbi:hypothetical protein RCL1_003866 [Eukaryota sp. TZLM3-RCL]